MYQLDANNFIMIFFLINGLYMFPTFSCPSSGVLIYRLLHCRMWCYAIGVEAVVLRICCVVLCTVCQLVSNCKYPKYVEAIYEKKITIKLFASSWYIFLTYIYMMHGHTYIIIKINFKETRQDVDMLCFMVKKHVKTHSIQKFSRPPKTTLQIWPTDIL